MNLKIVKTKTNKVIFNLLYKYYHNYNLHNQLEKVTWGSYQQYDQNNSGNSLNQKDEYLKDFIKMPDEYEQDEDQEEDEENLNEISTELFNAEIVSNNPQDNTTNKLKSNLFSLDMPKHVKLFLIIASTYLIVEAFIACIELVVNIFVVVRKLINYLYYII